MLTDMDNGIPQWVPSRSSSDSTPITFLFRTARVTIIEKDERSIHVLFSAMRNPK